MSLRHDVPADLRKPRQWLVWRYEVRDDEETKVPYRAANPQLRASTTDTRTWGSFEQAVHVLEHGQTDGVGFVFADDPFSGIDLDDCRNPKTGELAEWAAAIVDELASYSELSPSATGVHVITRARLRGDGKRRGPVEIYDRGRYFAMTGKRLSGVPWSPMPRQRELDALVARLFPPQVDRPGRATSPRSIVVHYDRELLERAFVARNGNDFQRLWNGDTSGYSSHSEADLALVSHLAFWTGGDPDRIDRLFRSSGLFREKWERADSGRGRSRGRCGEWDRAAAADCADGCRPCARSGPLPRLP